jgi:hypothetical protein
MSQGEGTPRKARIPKTPDEKATSKSKRGRTSAVKKTDESNEENTESPSLKGTSLLSAFESISTVMKRTRSSSSKKLEPYSPSEIKKAKKKFGSEEACAILESSYRSTKRSKRDKPSSREMTVDSSGRSASSVKLNKSKLHEDRSYRSTPSSALSKRKRKTEDMGSTSTEAADDDEKTNKVLIP